MISESARQSAAAENEPDRPRPTDPSRLHVAFAERHARKNSVSSDKGGSSVSDAASYMERLSVFSSATSIESSTTVGSSTSSHRPGGKETIPEELSLTTTNPIQQGMRPVSQDMFILRRSCRYNCHCACHEEKLDKPPRRFGRSKPQKIGCTDPICLGNEVVPDHSREHSSFFRSALSRATSARVIQVRYDLQSFRSVPNGSNAVRYVNHGNLPKLMECIESGEATIWDTTLDGWSLLHVSRLASGRDQRI